MRGDEGERFFRLKEHSTDVRTGLAITFISYPIIKLASGRHAEAIPLVYIPRIHPPSQVRVPSVIPRTSGFS